MAVNPTQMQAIQQVKDLKESIRSSLSFSPDEINALMLPLEEEIRDCAGAEANLKAAQDTLKTEYLALRKNNPMKDFGSNNNNCMLLSLGIPPHNVDKFRKLLLEFYGFIFKFDSTDPAITSETKNQIQILKRQLYQYAAGQDMSENEATRKQEQAEQDEAEKALMKSIAKNVTDEEVENLLVIAAQRRNGAAPTVLSKYNGIMQEFETEFDLMFLEKRLNQEDRFLDVADAQLAAIMLNVDIYIYDNNGNRQRVYAKGKDEAFALVTKGYAAWKKVTAPGSPTLYINHNGHDHFQGFQQTVLTPLEEMERKLDTVETGNAEKAENAQTSIERVANETAVKLNGLSSKPVEINLVNAYAKAYQNMITFSAMTATSTSAAGPAAPQLPTMPTQPKPSSLSPKDAAQKYQRDICRQNINMLMMSLVQGNNKEKKDMADVFKKNTQVRRVHTNSAWSAFYYIRPGVAADIAITDDNKLLLDLLAKEIKQYQTLGKAADSALIEEYNNILYALNNYILNINNTDHFILDAELKRMAMPGSVLETVIRLRDTARQMFDFSLRQIESIDKMTGLSSSPATGKPVMQMKLEKYLLDKKENASHPDQKVIFTSKGEKQSAQDLVSAFNKEMAEVFKNPAKHIIHEGHAYELRMHREGDTHKLRMFRIGDEHAKPEAIPVGIYDAYESDINTAWENVSGSKVKTHIPRPNKP